jgi:hypothetical protein
MAKKQEQEQAADKPVTGSRTGGLSANATLLPLP